MNIQKIIFLIVLTTTTKTVTCNEQQITKLNNDKKKVKIIAEEKKEITKNFLLIQKIISDEKNFLGNYLNYGGQLRIKNRNTQQFTNKEYVIDFSVPGRKILKEQIETFFIRVEDFFITELQEVWNYYDLETEIDETKKLNLDSKIKELVDEIKGESLEPKLAFTIKMYLCCEFICGNLLNELIDLFEITHLDLSNNNLYYLPLDCKKIENIKVLKLNKNKLRQVPIDIYKYINIEILEMNHNLLQNIGETVFLKKLQLLDVSHNLIKSLPINMINLINLKTLIINNNFLTTIPDNFLELPKLSVIDLHNNPKNAPISIELSEKILDKDKFQTIIGEYHLKNQKTPNLKQKRP